MKKIVLAAALLLSLPLFTPAQKKVFKEVSDGMSSTTMPIMQGKSLVGYLAFTKLEKINADSFHYKINIMDENLNDIGTVLFSEKKLFLQSVAIEQDVLCLGYLQSNLIESDYSRREYRKKKDTEDENVLTQFVDLSGKIIATNRIKVEIEHTPPMIDAQHRGPVKLKREIELHNISQKGFALFYSDERNASLVTYNTRGEQTWHTSFLPEIYSHMLVCGYAVYFLKWNTDNQTPYEGGYELFGYNTLNNTKLPGMKLNDDQGNALKVLAFDVDPGTGRPYIAGNIINKRYSQFWFTGKGIIKGMYSGVFTIYIDGPSKSDIHEQYTYWNGMEHPLIPGISRKGYFEDAETYARMSSAFRDYDGNTYFAASGMVKSPRWGCIASSIITAPLILPPLIILNTGTEKTKFTDGLLLKLDKEGKLSIVTTFPGYHTGYRPARMFYSEYSYIRKFNTVADADTKTTYLIDYDKKKILIYNVAQNKVVRTIQRKDGDITTTVYPAKEGHIMVSEYNEKEKSTTVSIESL
ncbi:DUF6770 family protein [Deminuibacter soli]|uniref:Uncharacterized protein n=1 Tax=Deminuibacter soli TaxID=2291815 RepID=A0A3E1NNZ4_9BACT|nr:DUF6770 family protein [Deminuibacter soli]RFM29544.1 hypothetical protein DXN05_00730 [Deminuibacter soli]